MLKEAAPKLERVALIYSDQLAAITRGEYFPSQLPAIEAAARSLSVEAVKLPYRNALEIVRDIDAFAAKPNGGLITVPPPPIAADLRTIIDLAIQHRLPSFHITRSDVVAGGFMTYTADILDVIRRAAFYVDRVLRGAMVSELPVQYPTKFRLVINLKTAKAIGLTVPNSLQLLADEVIE
jgi:putative tryptophan/tyrosine transport system substrate-binding protein